MCRKNPSFQDLTGAIQMRYRELRQGVGAVVKYASVITSEEEEACWQSKVIGDHRPLALLRAVFYYVGKTFCIMGGKEQRNLNRSQFESCCLLLTCRCDCSTAAIIKGVRGSEQPLFW